MSVPMVGAERDRSALPLVLLPGTLCDARVFAALLAEPALRGRAACVLPLPESRTVAEAAASVAARLPQRCSLLGFSLGGIVAMHAAARAPERVAALALIASTARAIPPAERAIRRVAADPDAAALHAIVERDLRQRYFGHVDARADAHRATVAAMAQALGGAALRRQTDLALDRPDARPLLPSLGMPALVLGGAEDPINPPAAQRALADLLPDASLAIVADAGHFVILERPDACAAAIDSWLARAETRIPMEEPA